MAIKCKKAEHRRKMAMEVHENLDNKMHIPFQRHLAILAQRVVCSHYGETAVVDVVVEQQLTRFNTIQMYCGCFRLVCKYL